jgi:hypothetical protein
MESYIGTVLIILIASTLSSAIYVGFNKNDIKETFYIFSFFVVIFYFVMSLVKLRLGYYKENLFESFWDIQGVTYLHYGMPLVVIAIALPIIMKTIFKSDCTRIIRICDSCICFVSFLGFGYVNDFSNKAVCVIIPISLVVAMAVLCFRLNCETAISKPVLKKFILALVYSITTAVIYSPNELYLGNSDDFPMSYWYFFAKILIAGIIMLALAVVCGGVYLTASQMNLLSNIIYVVVTMGYIQGMFLNGSMGELDGDIQLWSSFQKWTNILLWIFVILAFMALCFWKSELADKVVRIVSIWLILIQIVSLGTLIITSDATADKSELALTTDGMLEIGSDNNILVFVLDKFDGRRMDEILEDTPDFLEPLNDFVYYTNATSAFYPTECSIPYLLSGTEYEDDKDDYYSYVYSKDDVLIEQLYNKGYDIGLYTSNVYVPESFQDIVSNYIEGIERTCNTYELVSLMLQSSKYKMAPFICKEYFIYDTSDIQLLTATDDITNIENDLPFYNKLIQEGLSINDESNDGTYKFYHMHGAHPPYIMTEDFQYVSYDYRRDDGYGVSGNSQAKGALNIVFEYIRQLRELEKYDDATIIITSDHGTLEDESKEDGEIIQQSFPIMLVKMPNSVSDKMVISSAPVCHADLIATIKSLAGIKTDGKSITEIREDDDRTRISRIRTGDTYIKYEITGNVRNVENWKVLYAKD